MVSLQCFWVRLRKLNSKDCTNSDWFLVVDYLVFLAVAVARPGHICRTCLMEQTSSARKIQIRSSQ